MATVEFRCDLSEHAGPLTGFWKHTVGSCHAPLALRTDWQAQLRQCREQLGFRHVRFHGLLGDDVGVVHPQHDGLLYSFFNTDLIWEFLLSIGMKPFVELSFMPEALASGRMTVFHYRGNVTPPKDYKQWADLIRKLVAHWVEHFGIDEVRTWFFEVWNEPNQPEFWSSTQGEYFKLYRWTAEAIKAVDGGLRVGGPATSKNAWITEFLDFCTKHRVPVDFVSTHHYPTDAVGNEDQDTLTQLANSRRSILRQQTQDTCRRARGLPVYYTEWNSSSNPRDPLHDEPYAAAFAMKTVLEAAGLVEAYSFWTFSDIFEENHFPSVPFHGGFGLLNLHGIPKPVYRTFELLGRLGNQRLLVDGLHETVDAWVVQGEGNARETNPPPLPAPMPLNVVLTNHALPRHLIATEQVHIELVGVAEPQAVWVERIDEDRANPKRRWVELGRREYLRRQDIESLQAASLLVREPLPWKYTEGNIHVRLSLPPHAVAVLSIDFPVS
jgi:xylan 1,4-beta-xylosidase